MGMAKGDFIKIEYTGKRAANGQIFSTTSAEKAREAKIFDEKKKYGAQLVIIGSESVVAGLEEALLASEVGEEKSIELAPDKAFGARNQSLVRIVPISEFKKQDVEPYPGMLVSLDNATAIVRSVSGGRVMVDFNHPLAGEKIIYDFKVMAKLTDAKEKVKALADEESLAIGDDGIKLEGESLELSFGEGVKKDAEFFVSKDSFLSAIKKFLPEIKKVKISEGYDISTLPAI